jgi:hypothetical protein
VQIVALIYLYRMRPFDAAGNAGAGASIQAFKSPLATRQRNGVFVALIRSLLKPFEPVDDDGQQVFVLDAVHAVTGFADRAILEIE